MAGTKKQKGVKITRDGGTKFTVSWDHGQKNYTDQELIWYEVYKNTTDKNKKKTYEKSHKVNLDRSNHKKSISIKWSDYPPDGVKRLCKIQAKLRAKSKHGWSKFTSRATFDIKIPKAPTFNDENKPAPIVNANTAQYSWNVYDNGKNEMYHWSHYQVVELENFKGKSIDEVTWGSNARVRDVYLPYSATDPYNTANIPLTILPAGDNNVTQFFRVRTYGPRGYSSKWAYNWHVFGFGNQVKDTTIDTIKTEDGYRVTVDWSLVTDKKYKNPSDQVVVSHTVVTPTVTKTTKPSGETTFQIGCPNSPAPSWSDHSAVFDTSDLDRLVFQTNTRPGVDEVMFIQVNNLHDTSDTTRYGPIVPVIIDGSYGSLADPVFASEPDYNPNLGTVSISIDRGTTVPNSFCAVYVMREKDYTRNYNEPGSPFWKMWQIDSRYNSVGVDPQDTCIGILPFGVSSGVFSLPDVIDPSESVKFYIVNMISDYTIVQEHGINAYKFSSIMMQSSKIYTSDVTAEAPTLVLRNSEPGVILAEWDWTWSDAQSAELSWSTDKYAWESTDEPSRYVISNTHTGRWRISGLDYGRYYVRVRLIKSIDSYETYGLYSDPENYIDLTADVPPTPNLTVEPTTVAPNGELNCYWQYAAEDGSSQLQANLYEAFVDDQGNITYSQTPLACVNTGQHLMLDVAQLGWTSETSPRYLCIETLSSFGTTSGKSDVVSVRVAEPLNLSLTFGTGFTTTVEDDITYVTLTQFPFSLTVDGIDYDGSTSLYIRRAAPYLVERPDGTDIQGYQNETIYVKEIEEDNTLTINADDPNIIGSFDDGAYYEVGIVAMDQYGQTGTLDPAPIFSIDWDHKASIPSAIIDIDYLNSAAIIIPQAFPDMNFYIESDHVFVEAEEVEPENIGEMSFDFDEYGHLIYTSENAFADFDIVDSSLIVTTAGSSESDGDVCDIYRLTADQPELVFEGATFGETYVDPYPVIGQNGGYRIAYRTRYGDFKDLDGVPAWQDYGYLDGATLSSFDTIIDFDGYQVHLPFNLSISHKWEKDFTETRYLGGSIQGDWNPGVGHTLSISTDVAVEYFSETAQLMRILASYSGVCHVRTPDGSSFAANVVVSEDRGDKMIRQLAKFSLDITRVDQEIPDGMTYSDWIGLNETE